MVSSRVVLVKSCVAYRGRSRACEQTWAHDLRGVGVPVLFIEAGAKESQIVNQSLIRVKGSDVAKGAMTYPARRLCKALNLVLREYAPEFIFIADDDTYVHPQRWLEHEPEQNADIECRLFHCERGTWIHGGAGWYLSREMARRYARVYGRLHDNDDYVVRHAINDLIVSDRPDLYGGDRYSGDNHRVARDNNFITCHHVSADEMLALHRSLT